MTDTPAILTQEVAFRCDGADIKGCAAWPRRDGGVPAVVIVHDVRGLAEHYRDIARRFGAEGFFALAPDLYSREGTPDLSDPEAALAWMRQLDDGRVLGDIGAAVRFLGGRSEVRAPSIGIVGFCMGGQYALMAACTVPTLAAGVSFYGMLRYAEKTAAKPASPLDLAPRLGCPYLGLFGEEDGFIPAADVQELDAILRRTGKACTLKTYAGAGHAFFNDTRPEAYRPDAARDAWQRTLGFLRAHLG